MVAMRTSCALADDHYNCFGALTIEPLDLTPEELAGKAGMLTENVIQIRKKFQDDKLIIMNGKNIELSDLDALQRICDLV